MLFVDINPGDTVYIYHQKSSKNANAAAHQLKTMVLFAINVKESRGFSRKTKQFFYVIFMYFPYFLKF